VEICFPAMTTVEPLSEIIELTIPFKRVEFHFLIGPADMARSRVDLTAEDQSRRKVYVHIQQKLLRNKVNPGLRAYSHVCIAYDGNHYITAAGQKFFAEHTNMRNVPRRIAEISLQSIGVYNDEHATKYLRKEFLISFSGVITERCKDEQVRLRGGLNWANFWKICHKWVSRADWASRADGVDGVGASEEAGEQEDAEDITEV
jgi:hypothetical protein